VTPFQNAFLDLYSAFQDVLNQNLRDFKFVFLDFILENISVNSKVTDFAGGARAEGPDSEEEGWTPGASEGKRRRVSGILPGKDLPEKVDDDLVTTTASEEVVETKSSNKNNNKSSSSSSSSSGSNANLARLASTPDKKQDDFPTASKLQNYTPERGANTPGKDNNNGSNNGLDLNNGNNFDRDDFEYNNDINQDLFGKSEGNSNNDNNNNDNTNDNNSIEDSESFTENGGNNDSNTEGQGEFDDVEDWAKRCVTTVGEWPLKFEELEPLLFQNSGNNTGNNTGGSNENNSGSDPSSSSSSSSSNMGCSGSTLSAVPVEKTRRRLSVGNVSEPAQDDELTKEDRGEIKRMTQQGEN
jgi:hypothetical protein